MAEIGMGEAAKRMGIEPPSARRALMREGYNLRALSARAYVVQEEDVADYVNKHGVSKGRGRRFGDKNKPKEE